MFCNFKSGGKIHKSHTYFKVKKKKKKIVLFDMGAFL